MKHLLTMLSFICVLGVAMFVLPSNVHADEEAKQAEVAVEAVAEQVQADSMVKGVAEPWQLGFQEPATPVMAKLDSLHDELMVIITLITIFVMGLLWYVCVRFSAKNNKVPSKTTHNNLLEIIWTLIPLCILGYIGAKSLPIHYYMDKAQDYDMTLKVTGYQWYWGYEYPEYDNLEFKSYMIPDKEIDLSKGHVRLLSTDKPVVVPAGKTVRVLGTGADVIHNWAMPAFGIKMDVIPGRLNETWFRVDEPGIYYGQCSELCGRSHGFMPIEVRVVEQDVFDAWIKRAQDEEEFAMNGLSLPVPTPVEATKALVEEAEVLEEGAEALENAAETLEKVAEDVKDAANTEGAAEAVEAKDVKDAVAE